MADAQAQGVALENIMPGCYVGDEGERGFLDASEQTMFRCT